MTDIVIGTSKDLELFVRDANDDGVYDAGESIGVRGPGDRFDAARVGTALGRVGISHWMPGVRLHRIGAYMDYIREADALAASGDVLTVRSRLDQAVNFAGDNRIDCDESRLAELAWQAVDNASSSHAEGIDDLNAKDLEVLRRDDDPRARLFSAQRILDYLLARASIANVENSAGPGRSSMLEELQTRSRELSAEIASRSSRVHDVLVSGSRMTTADQASLAGTEFHVGDRVRYRDPESGEFWDAPFTITGFELRAEGVVVHGTELRAGTGEPYPHEVDLECLALAPEAEGAPLARTPADIASVIRREIGRFLSLFR